MIDVSEKYKPLFDLPRAWGIIKKDDFKTLSKERQKYWNDLSGVEVIVMTGGRGSGKSLVSCVSDSNNCQNYEHNVLYTRYTDSSLDDSVKPDFQKSLDMLGFDGHYDFKLGRIEFNNGAKIVFKGLKTSSKNQTATGKSLSGFSSFVVEEAEEHQSYDEWEKVVLSLRKPNVQNFSKLILNPPTKEHWIYQKFFEERGVMGGFNGVKDEILYIHTNWKDVKPEFHTKANLRKFREGEKAHALWLSLSEDERKEEQRKTPRTKILYDWYEHIILGGWLDKAEGVIFTNWIKGDFPEELPFVYGMDFGYSPDPTTLIKVGLDKKQKRVYVQEMFHDYELSTDDISELIKRSTGKDDLIIADNAEKRLIIELRKKNINILPCKKGADSIRKGLKDLMGYQIVVCGDSRNYVKELNNYVWNDRKAGVPIDAYNHCIDPTRYAMERLSTNFYAG